MALLFLFKMPIFNTALPVLGNKDLGHRLFTLHHILIHIYSNERVQPYERRTGAGATWIFSSFHCHDDRHLSALGLNGSLHSARVSFLSL